MNIEQGTRNVQCRSFGVRELNVLCSCRTSIFGVPCSIFDIPLDFKIQNSLFNIRYSLFEFKTHPLSIFAFFRNFCPKMTTFAPQNCKK